MPKPFLPRLRMSSRKVQSNFCPQHPSRRLPCRGDLICGPQLSRHEKEDVSFGWRIAREVARLDIRQTVVVKSGTILAVEGFDGTNETIKRGGTLAGKGAVVIKVAGLNQDMRFDCRVSARNHSRGGGCEGSRGRGGSGPNVVIGEGSAAEMRQRTSVSLFGMEGGTPATPRSRSG